MPVVLDHAVVVLALPADAAVLLLHVRAEVHARRVPPDEERLVAAGLLLEILERPRGDFVVDGLHALLGERAGVLDLLRPVRHRPAVDDAARPEALVERRVLGVVLELGLLLGVEVVEVAEELVEPVVGGQVLIAVAQVVLAELRRRVAERLEELGDGRVLGLRPSLAPGKPTLVMPVRSGFCPVMKAERPAVQLC